MRDDDTIAAFCTGAGGAVAILRLSGPQAVAAASAVWTGARPLSDAPPRQMLLGKVLASAASPGEPAMAVRMPAPASYTGQDVVELHVHGGPCSRRRLADAVQAAGARMAQPGEFTFRAFLNGKMDLTQAEAVADVVRAESDSALRLAERQLSGALGACVRALSAEAAGVLAECEARLDFPEEDLDFQSPEALASALAAVRQRVQSLLATWREGAVLRDGLRVAIAGRPNAGKSTLFNALLGYSRAITADTPGTTRDTLEERAVLGGVPVLLVDTAGFRESDDPVERMGVSRAASALAEAQAVLWVLDAAAPELDAELAELARRLPPGAPAAAVWNKRDLAPERPLPRVAPWPSCELSAKEGANLEALVGIVQSLAWGGSRPCEPELAVSARHAGLLREADGHLALAMPEVAAGRFETAAAALRPALAALDRVTGDGAGGGTDIYERIFSRFCIGK